MHYAVPIARRFKQDLHNTAWGQDLFTFANQISPTLQANLEHNAAKRLTRRANMGHFSTLLSNAITRAYQTEVYQQDPRPPSLLPYTHTHTEKPPTAYQRASCPGARRKSTECSKQINYFYFKR